MSRIITRLLTSTGERCGNNRHFRRGARPLASHVHVFTYERAGSPVTARTLWCEDCTMQYRHSHVRYRTALQSAVPRAPTPGEPK